MGEGGTDASAKGSTVLGGQVPKQSLLGHWALCLYTTQSPTSQEDPRSLCHLSLEEQESCFPGLPPHPKWPCLYS